MLIDRADNTINICEMKYCNEEYVVTKEDALSLAQKAAHVAEVKKKQKSIIFTMITVYGIAHAGYWNSIHNEATADALF